MDGVKERTADGGWTRRGPGPSAHRTSTTGLSQGGAVTSAPARWASIGRSAPRRSFLRIVGRVDRRQEGHGAIWRAAPKTSGLSELWLITLSVHQHHRAEPSRLSVLHVVDGGIDIQARLGRAFRRLALVAVEPFHRDAKPLDRRTQVSQVLDFEVRDLSPTLLG